tara:strand:- start:14764 stop:15006 length:243 start_codon:yes stop_codon:yes gene_type:complete
MTRRPTRQHFHHIAAPRFLLFQTQKAQNPVRVDNALGALHSCTALGALRKMGDLAPANDEQLTYGGVVNPAALVFGTSPI